MADDTKFLFTFSLFQCILYKSIFCLIKEIINNSVLKSVKANHNMQIISVYVCMIYQCVENTYYVPKF